MANVSRKKVLVWMRDAIAGQAATWERAARGLLRQTAAGGRSEVPPPK
jgi:hypothetical protein